MQTASQRPPSWFVLGCVLLALTACATTGPEEVSTRHTELGHWNDTDARATAEALMTEALEHPWSQRFTQMAGHVPVVIVGPVVTHTHAELNPQTFMHTIERALSQSGRVRFVPDTGEPQPSKRAARPEAVPLTRQEVGADFVVQGSIQSLVDELEESRTILYQVDLEIIDIASNIRVWLGQKTVKKVVERSKTTL